MMKLTLSATYGFLAISVLTASISPLQAADQKQISWTDVCRTAPGKELAITTANGDTVTGYCVAVSVDDVSIHTQDRGVVKVARTALSRIRLQRANRGHQLRTLRHDMHKTLTDELDWLFSPRAVGGIVSIPPTLAWGAVAVPFCLLGDLRDHFSGAEEIQVK
jgi:P pilus assembly chaperone PapD